MIELIVKSFEAFPLVGEKQKITVKSPSSAPEGTSLKRESNAVPLSPNTGSGGLTTIPNPTTTFEGSVLRIVPAFAEAADHQKIEIVPQMFHSSSVSSVVFSPDGARLLSGSEDKTMKLWDAATGRLIRTLEGHTDYINSVAFSPDGARVLSGSNDQTMKLWDVTTGALVRTFEGQSGSIVSVAFSPDGKRVLSGSDDTTMKLWDATTGNLLRTFKNTSYVGSVAFSPDGAYVLSGDGYAGDADSDHKIRLWDATSGALVRTFDGHSGQVGGIAFSPDGARVLSGEAGLRHGQALERGDGRTPAHLRRVRPSRILARRSPRARWKPGSKDQALGRSHGPASAHVLGGRQVARVLSRRKPRSRGD